MELKDVTFVFVAGVGNSGPGHWQRIWHDQLPNSVWVEQKDWDAPDREAWVSGLQATVWKLHGPMVVVAHSLGCLVLAEWARSRDDPSMLGAFLVAPPDTRADSFPPWVTGFGELTAMSLPFPAVVVASRDDPYATIEHAEEVAGIWGARFVDAGEMGHINAESGIGDWEEGRRLLEEFVAELGERG